MLILFHNLLKILKIFISVVCFFPQIIKVVCTHSKKLLIQKYVKEETPLFKNKLKTFGFISFLYFF